MIGESPWPLVPLGEVCVRIQNGRSVSQDKSGAGAAISRIETIASGVVDWARVGWSSDQIAADDPNWIECGDLLFSHINSPARVGHVAMFTGGGRLYHGINLLRMVPDTSRVFPKYFLYAVKSGRFRAHLKPFVNQSVNQASISIGNVKKLSIPLPPMEEQRRIAAILDEADELRKKRAESLTKLDTLKQSIFISMFGDLALNPKRWKETAVSEFVAGFETGVSLSLKDGEQAGSDSVLKISAVTSGRFLPGETKPVSKDWQAEYSHRVRQGDLLMSRANTTELVGATAYVFEDSPGCLLPDKLWRFVWQEPKCADPLFVSEAMKSRRVRQQIEDNATGSSGSMKNISQAKFLKTVMPCPPFELQAKFGQIVQQIEEQRFRGSCGFSELETLFASLQQEAFAGRL